MRRSFFVLAVCVCSVAVAACGSKRGGKVAVPAGAEVAPVSSLAFVSVDVDQARRQWRTLAGVVAGASGLPGLERLAGGACLRSLPSVLGKTVDIAVLTAGAGSPADIVVITRPADALEAKRALAGRIGLECTREIRAKVGARMSRGGGSKGRRRPPQLALRHATRVMGDWLLLSDSAATIDLFEREAKKGTLARSPAFRAAFSALPEDVLARAYLSGQAISGSAVGLASGAFRLLTTRTEPGWIAIAARPAAGGLRLDGAVSGLEARNAANSLITEAPASSRLALSFSGSSYRLDQTLERLASGAEVGRELARVESFLGLAPDELTTLAQAEIALFSGDLAPGGKSAIGVDRKTGRITAGSLGLELRGKGVAETARKIERRLPALASFLKGGARSVSLDGTDAEELTLGALRFFFAGAGGKLFLTSDASVIERGPELSSSQVFQDAERALPLPTENAGVLFAELDRTAGSRERPAMLAYLDASGGSLEVHGVLTIG